MGEEVSKIDIQPGEEGELPVHLLPVPSGNKEINSQQQHHREDEQGGEKTHKCNTTLPTEESALKIVYLRVAEMNEKYSHRVLNGYFKCRDELKEMFSKRYP